MSVNNKAFCYPYPDHSDHPAWTPRMRGRVMLWVQSPIGSFMLLHGGWANEATAREYASRAGYTMIDPDMGMAMLERDMERRFGNSSPLYLVQ